MPVVDTSVLLCGLAFPESHSGEFLNAVINKAAKGVISNTIRKEAIEIARKKVPHLEDKIEEFISNYSTFVEISDKEILSLDTTVKDKNDSHVIATAIASQEHLIYTLDFGFFTQKMRYVTQQHNIEAQFPSFEGYLKDPLEGIVDLPQYKPRISSSRGSVTLTLTTTWDSLERRHIDKRWYVLDADSIFGLWYETPKQIFKLYPYSLGNDQIKVIPKSFFERQHIRFTVTFDYTQGFDVYIDDAERHCNQKWGPILEPQDINVGHSSSKSDHINGIFQGIRVFGDYLTQRVVRVMHQFNLLSVSDKDLEITHMNHWLIQRPKISI